MSSKVDKAEFVDDATGVADGNDFIPSRDSSAYVIHTFVCGGSCDVYYERDTNGDGNYDFSEKIHSFSQGISQGNEVEVSEKQECRVRINNTSGGAADFLVTGDLVD